MTEYIKFVKHGEPIMTIHADGRITLRDDAQPTEAAAACIEAMSDMIQDMIKNAVLQEQSINNPYFLRPVAPT
jgi:ArsR family metal-binding transcriptional regulator